MGAGVMPASRSLFPRACSPQRWVPPGWHGMRRSGAQAIVPSGAAYCSLLADGLAGSSLDGPLPAPLRSVIVEYDATTPSLINLPYIGDEAVVLLKRPWWFEFKGRFGNIFYVREQVGCGL